MVGFDFTPLRRCGKTVLANQMMRTIMLDNETEVREDESGSTESLRVMLRQHRGETSLAIACRTQDRAADTDHLARLGGRYTRSLE